MKTKLTILVLLLLFCTAFISMNNSGSNTALAISSDTSIVNYYPMQVGNIWKYYLYTSYHFDNCLARIRKEVIGSAQLYGKTYFILATTEDSSRGGPCTTNTIDTCRIDSVSGNVLYYSRLGNCYLPHEIVKDSMRLKLHDTLKTCGALVLRCSDTLNTVIFGLSMPSKTFKTVVGFDASKTYVKNIGFIGYEAVSPPYYYETETLAGCYINGVAYGDTSFLVGMNQISNEVPKDFQLYQNYPNPFNPACVVKYDIPKDVKVVITIYDILGRGVKTLVNEFKKAGTYTVDFDGSVYASGVYFCRIEAGDPSTGSGHGFVESKKMVMIK